MLPLAMNRQVSQQLPRTNETECWRSHGIGLYEFTSLTSHIREQGTAKRLEDSASGDPIEKEKSTVDKNMTDCNDTTHDTLDRWKESKQHQSLQQLTAGAASLLRKGTYYEKDVQVHRGAARKFSRVPAAQLQWRHIVASKRNLATSVRKRLQTKPDHTSL